jgi:hypothetical protein
MIDHIDGNAANNRIENLREATNSQNLANHEKNKNNTSGFKGVYRRRADYINQFEANCAGRYLGLFPTAEAAAVAYNKAAIENYGAYAKVNEV